MTKSDCLGLLRGKCLGCESLERQSDSASPGITSPSHFFSTSPLSVHSSVSPPSPKKYWTPPAATMISPPPQRDPIFQYNPNLGSGVSKGSAKILKGELHFRVVPCVSRADATSLAADMQGESARIDMDLMRARARSPADWMSIDSQKDELIDSLRERIACLEKQLSEEQSNRKKL